METKDILSWLNPNIDRRKFLKISGALAATTAAGVGVNFAKSKKKRGKNSKYGENSNDTVETADDIIYSVCQMCHARCGIRCKVIDGVLVKIDGNPYHPNNLDVDADGNAERLTYSTATSDAYKTIGTLCIKGQSGIQTVYDPYRIQQPLKRTGARGEGKWQAISWETAFSEIASAIKDNIDFDNRTTTLIDSTYPEKGYIANQLVFSPGRSTEKSITERLFKYAWGTQNYDVSHTSICEVSRHVANELISWEEKGTKTKMGGGKTSGWQPDILGSEYIIYFGSNPLEAGFPMNGMSRNLMHFKRNGGKFVVVDPRFNNTASKANEWVPIKPGTDAALALAVARWIIENDRHETTYLSAPNSTIASANGEKTWTDSTYLVGDFTDSSTGKTYKRYLRSSDLTAGTFASSDTDYVVKLTDGTVKKLSDVSSSDSLDLEASGSYNNGSATISYKSSFLIFKEQATSKTLAEWSAICGVSESTIKRLANEFTSHGKKAVAAHYRGPCKHTNGVYNVWCVQHLNTLIGNYDWKGGNSVGGGGWKETESSDKTVSITGFYDTSAKKSAKGLNIMRAKAWLYPPADTSWSDSYVSDGYWAKNLASNLTNGKPTRPFFPLGTHGNYQEAIPSAQDEYPYPAKVLITYWNAWPYATPALKKVFSDTLTEKNGDEYKIPLFVAVSPVMGETAAYADYVLPDTTYLEKFSFPGIPWRVNKGTSFQRPVVGYFDGKQIGVKTDAGGAGNTIDTGAANDFTAVLPNTKATIDIWIGLANALGVGGFGDNAIASGKNLNNSWDYAKVQLENVVTQYGSTLTIDDIISKGGVFDDPGSEYSGDYLAYRFGNIVRFFSDPVARTRDSVTGDYWDGFPKYEEIKHSDGTVVSDSGYSYKLITYKTVNHGQARTIVNPWLMLPMSDNYVEISTSDAETLGVETGDFVKVTSASNTDGITTRAKVTEGIMPGVVAISHHFGHWEMSSKAISIDGSDFGYDASRAAGVQPNEIMRADGTYPNVSLQDKIGASVSFFDTWVNVAKA